METRSNTPSLQPGISASANDTASGLRNLHQLIQLRWIAAAGQLLTIQATHYSLGMKIPLEPMLAIVGAMAFFNLACLLRWHSKQPVFEIELFIGLLVDVAALTAQLYLSGGIGNPFVFLYLLQIAVGAMLLRGGYIGSMVGIASACVAFLAMYSIPLPLEPNLHLGLSSPYVLGLLVCFLLNAVLVVVFITRINTNLRRRDARLAAARQRAAEEEHIVRMGLLASGAAHELGTPLATLAVILGDWKHMPAVVRNPGLKEDIAEMEAQVQRCKSIVSGILLSAGETRGEDTSESSVRGFLDNLVREWRSSRSVEIFEYVNEVPVSDLMVADTTFEQMIFNVLDNAREVSPQWIQLHACRDDDMLRITITDRGPGFADDVLARLGAPYQSTKGRPGGGLGLFLSMNVARTLGGSLHAENLPHGGARVTIVLSTTDISPSETQTASTHGT
jgi:two-component system sensor histidine kinase RegB